MLGSIDETKFGIIGIYNDTEVPQNHRLRSMLVDFRSVHPVETVHLKGLSPSAVEELTERGGRSLPADLVPRLCQMTDGNPLFLDELLRQLRWPGRGGPRGREPGAAQPEPDRDRFVSSWPAACLGYPRT